MDRGQFRRRPRVCRGQRPAATQPYLGLPDVLEVWNDQESAWIPCPVGHSVVKGRLGEFYPISPAAIAETYEPADGDQVTVSREDLRALLADNELTTEAAQVAYGRLSAAAGDPQ